jgi:hypothetical protein
MPLPHLARWLPLLAAACITQVTVSKDVNDDTPDPPEDTPAQPDDTPDDTPEDTPDDTPVAPPAAVPPASQGCAAALRASDGTYQTTGCLAPLQATPSVVPLSDGAFQLEPGALRRIEP